MKERPILFTGPMVRAVLNGNKTQTRRIVKRPKECHESYIPDPSLMEDKSILWWQSPYPRVGRSQDCPYGKPGDRLWVRENFRVLAHAPGYEIHTEDGMDFCEGAAEVIYIADDQKLRFFHLNEGQDKQAERFSKKTGVIPNIFLPYWASRINREIVHVRVESLQDISEDDALAEGIVKEWGITGANCNGGNHCEEHGDIFFIPGNDFDPYETAVDAYKSLWNSINGDSSWDENPYVWVIEFKPD